MNQDGDYLGAGELDFKNDDEFLLDNYGLQKLNFRRVKAFKKGN
jgi:hypothetical protein